MPEPLMTVMVVPGLAPIHDRAIYDIANSQWDRFDANGGLPPADQLEAPRIMRLSLR